MASRERYVEVGAAIRQAVFRAAEQQVTAREYRSLVAIIGLVASYSRLVDHIPVRRSTQPSIAGLANLPDKQVGAALKLLAEKRIIVYAPARGRGRVSLVGLPTAGEYGEYFAPPERDPSTGTFSGGEKAPSTVLKGPIRHTKKAPWMGPSREVLREVLPRTKNSLLKRKYKTQRR